MTPEKAYEQLMRKHRFSPGQIEWGIRAGFKCEYCGRDLLASVDDYDSWQADHIYPQSKKGDGSGFNMAIACKTCNFLKRAIVLGNAPTNEDERLRMVERAKQLIAEKRAVKQAAVAEVRHLAQILLNAVASPLGSPVASADEQAGSSGRV